MLIVGAKGFAKEVLEVLNQLDDIDNLAFYDDLQVDAPEFLYKKFEILKTIDTAQAYFKNIDDRFTLGVGNPVVRKKLFDKLSAIGGQFASTISPLAHIGSFGNSIQIGCNIMTGSVITNDISIGRGVLINLNCTVGHDSNIGEFVELSPGVHISGNCNIGNYSVFGTNSTLLPGIKVGTNVVVGAGSVVTKDVPDNCLVVGTPAIIKKELPKLEF